MKIKVFYSIAIRIIILFTIAIFSTFIPDYLREFFGDTLHECGERCTRYCANYNTPDKLYDWGARHYWYATMTTTLFTLALASVILSIMDILKKNYDNL